MPANSRWDLIRRLRVKNHGQSRISMQTKHTNNRPLDVNKKVQLDATVCRHLFTAESLYMFLASQHPSSRVLKTVSATSGIGHAVKYRLKLTRVN